MQFIFATVPNQLANNQVLTVEFCRFFKKIGLNISMYHELCQEIYLSFNPFYVFLTALPKTSFTKNGGRTQCK